jgi:TetR/AcrR family transcriptional regulator
LEEPRRPGRPARPVTRDHLLKVARDAFSQLGYAGASMGDIAARAGIRKSSLFHHFATKDELYREALAVIVGEIGKRVESVLHVDGQDFLSRLDTAALGIQRYFGENPVAARLLMREFVDGGQALTAAGEAVDGVLRSTVQLLEVGMSEGVVPKQDPRHLAISMVGIHFQFFATPEVSGRLFGCDPFEPIRVEERAKTVVQHLRRLMGVKDNAPN